MKTRALTHKQTHFAQLVASGSTLSDAYRTAYETERMGDASIRVAACRLAAHPKVRLMIERKRQLQDRQREGVVLSDREKVLDKLRHLLDSAEGTPAEQVMLRAAHLLGQTQAMYTHVTETTQQRSAAEIEADITERLQTLLGDGDVLH